MKNHLIWGQWNAICDRCGLKFKSSQLRRDWQGLMVDDKCYETRHPQDLIRIRGERGSVPWSRPVGEDPQIAVCYIWDTSAYAGLAEAGCMVAGKTTSFSGTQLAAMKAGT